MASNHQPDRWESLILAGVMAAAGTWFLFDNFASIVRTVESLHSGLHSAPALLAGVAISLIIASAGTEPASTQRSQEGHYE